MNLPLPYNFVPLTSLIVKPDWARRVSHDHPFADGLCGELAVTLRTHTPLCVGGRQTSASNEAAGKVHFYRTPDGQLAIPGTSLKGMLRNVVEIAAFGHFRGVEERTLGVRDLSQANNFYFERMQISKPKAGWLTFDQGRWWLTPCQFVRVHQQDIVKAFGLNERTWINAKTVKKRYELLGGLKKLSFEKGTHEHHPQGVATNLGKGTKNGILVVTGQPGSDDYKSKKGKKWEFIFYAPAERKEVPQPVMDDFQFIHAESEDWKYWKRSGRLEKEGVPVFWRGQGDISAIGLAMLFKVVYPRSLHDAIRNSSKEHLESRDPDLAELIFGHLDADGKGGLRGRVAIAGACCDEAVSTRWTRDTVLNNPKPTFYPAYIEQREQGPYVTLMDSHARLSGWKRYPVKGEEVQGPPDKAGKKVQVSLETVPAGTSFTTTIRFHNLRPVELGALLWALDFGERSELRHGLGMGKPYGLGQVSLHLNTDASQVQPNDQQRQASTTEWLCAARIAFVDYMNRAWQSACGDDQARWEKSAPITELLAMADPEEGRKWQRSGQLRYPTDPQKFQDAKKRSKGEWRRMPYSGQGEKHEVKAADVQAHGITLDRLLELSAERLQKEAREAEKSEAQGIERYLMDIEDWLSKESLSKTERKKLEKTLKQAGGAVDESPEHIERFSLLVKRAAELHGGNDALGKVIKNLLTKLAS